MRIGLAVTSYLVVALALTWSGPSVLAADVTVAAHECEADETMCDIESPCTGRYPVSPQCRRTCSNNVDIVCGLDDDDTDDCNGVCQNSFCSNIPCKGCSEDGDCSAGPCGSATCSNEPDKDCTDNASICDSKCNKATKKCRHDDTQECKENDDCGRPKPNVEYQVRTVSVDTANADYKFFAWHKGKDNITVNDVNDGTADVTVKNESCSDITWTVDNRHGESKIKVSEKSGSGPAKLACIKVAVTDTNATQVDAGANDQADGSGNELSLTGDPVPSTVEEGPALSEWGLLVLTLLLLAGTTWLMLRRSGPSTA